MTSTRPDPDGDRSKQRAEWDSVSEGWRKWWPLMEQNAMPVSERLLDMAGAAVGQSILDLATGIGEPAVSAARRVGAEGRVTATDLSSRMLEIARERACELGLDNIAFHQMDGEGIDALEGPFDAALCRWGLMFMPDPGAVLRKIRSLLRPGGAMAAAVWDVPAKVPFLSLPMAVLKEALELPPPPPGAPGLFSLADVEHLEGLFERAGFTGVEVERVEVTFNLPSVEDYLRFLQEVAGPIIALLDGQSPERRAELWRSIGEAAADHTGEDGGVGMKNTALCVRATA